MRAFKAILNLASITIVFMLPYFENRLTWSFIGMSLAFFTLSSAVHLVAHELGHFIGGLMSGYELLFLQLGPIIIARDKVKPVGWKASIHGQCVMIPKQTNPVRYKAYSSGGIVANALVVVLSFLLSMYDSVWTNLLFVELLCIGIKKIIVNAVPYKYTSTMNDGYTIRLLGKNKAVRKDYALYMILFKNLYLMNEILLQDYNYEREMPKDEDEMVYYNEIQDILTSLGNKTM